MKLEEAIQILTAHNGWRRSNKDFPEMQHPRQLGVAIDVILYELKKHRYTMSDLNDVYNHAFTYGEKCGMCRKASKHSENKKKAIEWMRKNILEK